MTRPFADDQAGTAHDAGGIAPGRQIDDRVRTEEQPEIVVWVHAVQHLERVGRVTRAAAILLQFVDAKGWLTGNGEGNHLHAMLEACERPVKLVRRPGGWDEPNLIEFGLLPALLGQNELSETNPVARAAENADSGH